MFEEVLDIFAADFVMPLEHLAQPGDLRFITGRGGSRVTALVLPVSADTELCFFMHLFGADLYFHNAVVRANHSGME